MPYLVADMVWPALFIEQRLLSFWSIGLGLLIEYLFVRRLTTLSVGRSILADLTMNAASSLLGIVLIPLIGLAWELSAGILINGLLHFGTFNPIGWTATIVLAAFVNSVVESTVLRFVFRQSPAKRIFWWLVLANAITVALAFASLSVISPSDKVPFAIHARHHL